MIKPDYIQRLKDRVDIVTIIGDCIPLKKAGSQWKACCPFHNESTPSFSVSKTRQTFKCFGCGQAGDVLEFVIKYKNYSLPEAVEYLAGPLHDTVEYESSNRPKSRFDGIRL
jgi:DNA primase